MFLQVFQMFYFRHIINERTCINSQITLIQLFFSLLFMPVNAEHESPVYQTIKIALLKLELEFRVWKSWLNGSLLEGQQSPAPVVYVLVLCLRLDVHKRQCHGLWSVSTYHAARVKKTKQNKTIKWSLYQIARRVICGSTLPKITYGEVIFYQNLTNSHHKRSTDIIFDANTSALRKIC